MDHMCIQKNLHNLSECHDFYVTSINFYKKSMTVGSTNTVHGLYRLHEPSQLSNIVFHSKYGLTDALKLQLSHFQTNFMTDIRIPDRFFTFIPKTIIGINNKFICLTVLLCQKIGVQTFRWYASLLKGNRQMHKMAAKL